MEFRGLRDEGACQRERGGPLPVKGVGGEGEVEGEGGEGGTTSNEGFPKLFSREVVEGGDEQLALRVRERQVSIGFQEGADESWEGLGMRTIVPRKGQGEGEGGQGGEGGQEGGEDRGDRGHQGQGEEGGLEG